MLHGKIWYSLGSFSFQNLVLGTMTLLMCKHILNTNEFLRKNQSEVSFAYFKMLIEQIVICVLNFVASFLSENFVLVQVRIQKRNREMVRLGID